MSDGNLFDNIKVAFNSNDFKKAALIYTELIKRYPEKAGYYNIVK